MQRSLVQPSGTAARAAVRKVKAPRAPSRRSPTPEGEATPEAEPASGDFSACPEEEWLRPSWRQSEEARGRLARAAPEHDGRPAEDAVRSSLYHIMGAARDCLRIEAAVNDAFCSRDGLLQRAEAAEFARDSAQTALSEARQELSALRSEAAEASSRLSSAQAELVAQRESNEVLMGKKASLKDKVKTAKKKAKSFFRQLQAEEGQRKKFESCLITAEAQSQVHLRNADSFRVLYVEARERLKTVADDAVARYKLSEAFKEEGEEAASVGYGYGYGDCLKKVKAAFPGLDVSALELPSADERRAETVPAPEIRETPTAAVEEGARGVLASETYETPTAAVGERAGAGAAEGTSEGGPEAGVTAIAEAEGDSIGEEAVRT